MKRNLINSNGSNIFIHVLLKNPGMSRMFKDLRRNGAGEEREVISTLALSQVASHLARQKRVEQSKFFIDYIRYCRGIGD